MTTKTEQSAIQNNYSPFLPWVHGKQKCSSFFVRPEMFNEVESKVPDHFREGTNKKVGVYDAEGVVRKEENPKDFAKEAFSRSSIPFEDKYTTGVSYLCPAACFACGQAFQIHQKNTLRLINQGLNTPLPLAFKMEKDKIITLEQIAQGSELSLWKDKNIVQYMRECGYLGNYEKFNLISPERKTEICYKLMDRNLDVMKRMIDAPIQHWQQLIHSYSIMAKNRVYIDAQGENVFFHDFFGFPVIDYDIYNLYPPTDQSIKKTVDQKLGQLVDALGWFGSFFQKNGGGNYRVDEFLKSFEAVKTKLAFTMKSRENIDPVMVKSAHPADFLNKRQKHESSK